MATKILRNIQSSVFLTHSEADIYAESDSTHKYRFFICALYATGEIEIELPYLGLHVSNALAAASLAIALGATLDDVKKGLALGKRVKGRLFPVEVNSQLTLLDDTYNANVDSLKRQFLCCTRTAASEGVGRRGYAGIGRGG